jgi:hypothetical protein
LKVEGETRATRGDKIIKNKELMAEQLADKAPTLGLHMHASPFEGWVQAKKIVIFF